MAKSHQSRWLARQARDPYVKAAQKSHYRSRAVFKLQAIDKRDHLLRPGLRVLDIGAAPGSWSQVIAERIGQKGVLVAVDLLPMQPIAGVKIFQGDVCDPNIQAAISNALSEQPADLIVSDMAPNISGIPERDMAQSLFLSETVLSICPRFLKSGGHLLIKVFDSAEMQAFRSQLKTCFETVAIRKPEASRQASRECYLLAKNFALQKIGEAF